MTTVSLLIALFAPFIGVPIGVEVERQLREFARRRNDKEIDAMVAIWRQEDEAKRTEENRLITIEEAFKNCGV